jgi:F-type H+-transporting ATPase subunit b
MQIDWWTLVLQAINFLVLVWLLQRFLYRPVKAVVERRREETDRVFAEAEDKQREADAAKSEFERRQEELATERRNLMARLHRETESEREKVMAQARKDADRVVEEARAAIETERREALTGLRNEAARLASAIARTMLRNAASPAVAEQLFGQLDEHMSRMDGGSWRSLLGPDPKTAEVTVRCAPALDDEAETRWKERLARHFGDTVRLTFETDDHLIAGAQLRLPGGILEFNWAHLLEDVERSLARGEPDRAEAAGGDAS